MGVQRISVGGGGWDDEGGGGDEQCATPPAPPSFSLMTGEAAMKRVTAPWRRRRWGGCAERRRAVRAASVAAAVLLAVVVLSCYASWGSHHDEMPASLFTTRGSEDATPANLTDDQLLGGLLTATFSPQSCRSRYEFAGYHKRKPAHKPSPYLVAKLRKHEALQKRCGPGTASYEKALRQLKSGDSAAADDDDCRYLVSISYNRGLGNRVIAIVSAFLYAVLTERALLVAPHNGDVASLFCEPFPATTWLLPDGRRFPLRHLPDLDGKSKESLGALLKSNAISVAAGVNGTSSWSGRPPPPYVYLHLDGGADYHDKLFYCDEQQRLLRGVPWLLMKTDSYLVPGLFLVPSLRGELGRMFSEKDAVFHHLSRYLLHPANAVWHAITAYHRDHLAGAGQLVGIQIRVYHKERPPVSQVVLDQALSCARREKLLPASGTNTSSDQAVLVTSLSSWYYEKIRDDLGGGAVAGGVHQPSHEGLQRMGDTAHDMRALSEMYLLSTCDALLTTGFSTFGYVAQGLAGVRPWVMPRRPWWEKEPARAVPDPPCARVATPEPCFHSPSFYDCAARRNYEDIGKALPYVRRCEDVSWGIQLVNGSSQSQW